MLKEIHHGNLLMFAFLSFQLLLKFTGHVKNVLNKTADSIPV